MTRYEIQTIKDKEAPHGVHYRVTEIATDSRVATCYLKENAQLVCDALNEYPGPRVEDRSPCKVCGSKTRLQIVDKREADDFGLKIGDPICWTCLA